VTVTTVVVSSVTINVETCGDSEVVSNPANVVVKDSEEVTEEDSLKDVEDTDDKVLETSADASLEEDISEVVGTSVGEGDGYGR
jgi:hypothetical protein